MATTTTTTTISTFASRLHFDQEKRLRGEIKHGILKTYMDGWLPTLSVQYSLEDRDSEKLLIYVDGFAGPGKHKTNQIGSPLLVCDALANHSNLRPYTSILLIFMEKNKANYNKLVRNIGSCIAGHNAAGNVQFIYEYESTTFEDRMKETKDSFIAWRSSGIFQRPKIFVIVEHGDFRQLIHPVLELFQESPMCIFADPFGWEGIPMEVFHKILSTSHSGAPKDLLINLMDGNIRRFIDNPGHQKSLKRLIGRNIKPPYPHPTWHDCDLSSEEKLDEIYSAYISNMEEGYETVLEENELCNLKFAIKGKNNAHVYHLVFLCTHEKSIKRMKGSMNKYSDTDGSNDFTFSEWTKQSHLRDFVKEKKEAANQVFQLIKDNLVGDVYGRRIETFIWKKTPFHFNFKSELIEMLIHYRIPDKRCKWRNEQNAFDKNLYCITKAPVVVGTVKVVKEMQCQSPTKKRKRASATVTVVPEMTEEEEREATRKRNQLINIHYELLLQSPNLYDFIF